MLKSCGVTIASMSKSYNLAQHYPPMGGNTGTFTKKGSGTFNQKVEDDENKNNITSRKSFFFHSHFLFHNFIVVKA